MSEHPPGDEIDPSQEAGYQHSARRKRKLRPSNPLQAGICEFLLIYTSSQPERRGHALCISLLEDISLVPKRFTVYRPLLLLPSNFFPASQSALPDAESGLKLSLSAWHGLISRLAAEDLQELWRCLVSAFRKDNVTHIAVGAPIQLQLDGIESIQEKENILRRPTSVKGVFGHFGISPSSQAYEKVSSCKSSDSTLDYDTSFQSLPQFDDALWVQSAQNGGIVQVWAPMWTMFSRGNIKEKARVLSGVSPSTASPSRGTPLFSGLDGPDGELGQDLGNIAVLDMYVGIGYFAFSYLKRGVGLAIGFELNPWSVEGLRRGAEKNGWKCHVVRLPKYDDQKLGTLDILGEDPLEHLQHLRLLVFLGDNRWAVKIMSGLKRMTKDGLGIERHIRHVNLGLLPTSSASWSDAERLLSEEKGGWLHVHENVEVLKIEEKSREVEAHFEALARRREPVPQHIGPVKGPRWKSQCVHVEKVKTYAPGIMHCVFDVLIYRRSDI